MARQEDVDSEIGELADAVQVGLQIAVPDALQEDLAAEEEQVPADQVALAGRRSSKTKAMCPLEWPGVAMASIARSPSLITW